MRNNFAKKLGLSLAAFGLVATSVFTGSDAQAVPAFARQTGMPCTSCHFQSFPAISQMGRSFKAGGFVMEGTQASLEGENQLKLPDTLNIGAVIKMRHNKGSGDYTKTADHVDYGRIDFPDEAALLIGGRASANAGFLWEVNIKETPNLLGSKVVFNAAQAGDVQFQIIPYMTDGQGPTYGFELLNTASLGLQRYSESKVGSAPIQLGFVLEAAGIDLVATAPNWYVTYNLWAPANFPESGGEFAGNPTGLASFIRAVYMMDLAGFDTAFGLGSFGGTAKTMVETTDASGAVTGASEIQLSPAGSFFDVQLQGDLAGMSTGIYITSGSVPAGSATGTNFFAAGADADGNYNAKSSTGFALKMEVIPTLSLVLQNGSLDDGSGLGSQALSDIGVQYMIAQNIKFEYNIETTAAVNAAGDGYEGYTKNQMMLFMAF